MEAFGDRPCYGLLPQFHEYFPSTKLIATVRPRLHWLKSMFRNPSTGDYTKLLMRVSLILSLTRTIHIGMKYFTSSKNHS